MVALILVLTILAQVAPSTDARPEPVVVPLPELVGAYTRTDQGKQRVLSLDPRLQPLESVRLYVSGFASSGVGTCAAEVWVAAPILETFIWTGTDMYSAAGSVLPDGSFELEVDITRIHAVSGNEAGTWGFLFAEGARLVARLGGLIVIRECYFPIYPEIVVTGAELRITLDRVPVKPSNWGGIKALYR